MSISSIEQWAHKLAMSGEATHPHAPKSAITPAPGLGRALAASQLLGVLGDVIADDPPMAVPGRSTKSSTESPGVRLELSGGLRLVMFSMTFGVESRPQPQKEEAAA
jgi:hypothetical protein